MKESNSKGVANRTGPESCRGGGNSAREALTGVRAGWVSSREIHAPMRKHRVLRGADAVETGGRQHRVCRQREAHRDPARSETPGTHGINSHGNREVLVSSAVEGIADRIEKPKGERR
jgi:hypothetical protein